MQGCLTRDERRETRDNFRTGAMGAMGAIGGNGQGIREGLDSNTISLQLLGREHPIAAKNKFTI